MNRVAMTRVFLSALLAATLFDATGVAQISAPRLGLLPDSGAIRAMNGIAGSGSIGPLLGGGQTFSNVAVAPGGGFAVASTLDGNVAVVTLGADGASLQTSAIAGAATRSARGFGRSKAGAAAGAASLVLSPNGSAALVVNGGEVQVISGLPAAPVAQAAVDTSYLGAATALAVSDDGQWAAGVFGGAVFAIGTSGQAIPLPAPSGVSALTFFHGTSDLAVTTAAQVVKIANVGATPAASTIFGSADTPPPPEAPMALALTADNGIVVLLEPDGGIGQVVLASGVASIAQCGCTPQGLVGLGGSVFRLSNLDSGVVKVYDAASGDVLFVPLAVSG